MPLLFQVTKYNFSKPSPFAALVCELEAQEMVGSGAKTAQDATPITRNQVGGGVDRPQAIAIRLETRNMF